MLKCISGAYLVRTCDDLGELALLLILAFDDGFDDGGMVGPKVDKDVTDAVLPERLEEGKGCCVAGGSQYMMRVYKRDYNAILTPCCLPCAILSVVSPG